MSLISIPKFFMLLFGIWPAETIGGNLSRKFYWIYRTFVMVYYITFALFLTIECVRLATNHEKPQRISGSLALVVTIIIIVIKALIYQKNKIPIMCQSIVETENEILKSNDNEIKTSYEVSLKFGKYINIAVMLTTSITVLSFTIVPFAELWKVGVQGWNFDEKSFMYELYFPFNKKTHFTWVAVFNVYAGSLGIILNIACQTMFYSLIVFGASRLEMLQIRLRKFPNFAYEFHGNIPLTIKNFIKEHQDLARYSNIHSLYFLIIN